LHLSFETAVAIRGKAADQKQATELVLTNSCRAGDEVCISINRQYLARAVRFGLTDLCFYGNNSALLGHGEDCRYVWMPLTPDTAVKTSNDVLRVESPRGTPAVPVPQPKEEKVTPMSEPNNSAASSTEGTGQASPRKVSRRKAALQDLAGLIKQAETMRSALRENLVQTNALLKGLKQHRRHNKAIQNTLESIKQLKTLGV